MALANRDIIVVFIQGTATDYRMGKTLKLCADPIYNGTQPKEKSPA